MELWMSPGHRGQKGSPLPGIQVGYHHGRLKKTLIQALPMREDIETLINRVEDAHRREFQRIQTKVQVLTECLTADETVT